jgi:hypothetical protein
VSVHPVCEPSCTHRRVPDRGGRFIQLHESKGSRQELEPAVLEMAGGETVEYLGVQGPQRGGDDPWPMHTWRIGATPWNPPARGIATEDAGKAKREIKYELRPEVWVGSGEPVKPLDMSRDWPADHERVPYPEPIVGACEPDGSVLMPRPVTDLQKYASAQGWAVMLTYAYGWLPHATYGTPGAEPKHSWGVRMRRGGTNAVAVYMGGKWESLWTWSNTGGFVHHKGITVFKEAVR